MNGVATQTAGSYCVFEGVVASSTLITNLTLLYGNPQNYAAGSLTRVYIPVSAEWNKQLINGLLTSMNPDGSLKTSAVQTAIGTSNQSVGWTSIGQTLTYSGNNGNKEFTCSTPVDLTGTLAVGMKLQLTRGTTAPTQSMAFTAASSQYASKASPTGIPFTSTYTFESWVYLNSYTLGMMASRYSGTNGFRVYLNASGQIFTDVQPGNATTKTFNTYQSIPLKRFVHIAVSVNLAGTTSFYINGVPVPSTSSGSATSLTQAGNFVLGSDSNTPGTNNFDGYMSEARLWSVAQSQASIQANMAISLTGSETNLVGLWQGNGVFTDKTSNANTLTASGGAIATQLANPYNNVEYGIVTKVTSTLLTIFTGTDYNIPNMTLTGAQYSTQRSPYGFPAGKSKWMVENIYRQGLTQSGAAANTWYNPGAAGITLPIGDWSASYQTIGYCSNSTAKPTMKATLSTANNTEVDNYYTEWMQQSTTNTTLEMPMSKAFPLLTAAQTQYYLICLTDQSGAPQIGFNGNALATTIVRAECAYI